MKKVILKLKPKKKRSQPGYNFNNVGEVQLKKKKKRTRAPGTDKAVVAGEYPNYFVPLGRPAECNALIKRQMVYYIEKMVPIHDACSLTGLFENTHYRWIKLGKEYIAAYEEQDTWPDKKNRHFAEYFIAINRAVAEMRQTLIGRSLAPAELIPTWIRDMTILERRDRDHWARSREPLLDQKAEFDPDESFL